MTSFMKNFESLGSNCEFGFVLHRAGVTEGSLFKWCLVDDFSHLIAALKGRFEDLYEPQNLTPRTETMVRDKKYGLCFHTKLKIGLDGKKLVFFADSADEMNFIYQQELHKMSYLVAKFIENLASKRKIYVIRGNTAIPNSVARIILDLLREVGDASLVVMRQADERNAAGTVNALGEKFYEGYVSYISTSPALQDIEDAGWIETCKNVWEVHSSKYGLDAEPSIELDAGEVPVELPEDFDEETYVRLNPDIADIGMTAREHYLSIGWKERRPLA